MSEEPKPHERLGGRFNAIIAVVVILGLVGLTGVLIAEIFTDTIPENPLETFSPVGPDAESIDDLSKLVFGIAGIVFVLVMGAIVFVIAKFRDKGDGDELPYQLHGNTKLELGWTILPAVILIGLAIPTVQTIFEIEETDDDALAVEVWGQQWWWEFRYPDAIAEGRDVVTAGELVIPVGREVTIALGSRDVIHSFWVPQLAGKRDAVPGRTHQVNLQADQPGVYSGICQEFCGLSHANMRFFVRALEQADYEAWLANQARDAVEPPAGSLAEEGKAVYSQLCTGCHQINGVNEVDSGAVPLVAGAAPNLTHFADRNYYAGALFKLRDDDGSLNEAQLRAWLRNPPAEKPMYPEGNRGMPNLGLSEAQIEALVAYLTSLN